MKNDTALTTTVVPSPARPMMRSPALRGNWTGLAAGVLLTSALAPFLGAYGLRIGTTVLMFVALAQAWNLIGGYAGLLALAHPAFFGTGAVAFAVMLINGLPIWAAAPLACVMAVVLAALVGIPTLRLRGHYFVIATLLAAEGVRSLVLNFDAFGFRGGIAVNIIARTGLDELSASQYNLIFYFSMLAAAVLSMSIAITLDRSKWGYALRAFRDNRDAASALGIHVSRLLLIVFMTSAALTSLVGSIWAAWLGVVEPNEAFGLKLTFEIVVMVFLGGKSTVWGPVLGAMAILLLDEMIGVEFAEFTLIVSGLIVVLVILFLPDGLVRLFKDGPRALAWSTLKANFKRYRVRG